MIRYEELKVGDVLIYYEGVYRWNKASYNQPKLIDKVIELKDGKIKTESGIKIRVLTGVWTKGELRISNTKKNKEIISNMNWHMTGKTKPTNLYDTFSIWKDTEFRVTALSETRFTSIEEMIEYELEDHKQDLEDAIKKDDFKKDQEEKKNKAFEELYKLKEDQEAIREKLSKEFYDLKRDLIEKHCKNIKYDSSGYPYCEEW